MIQIIESPNELLIKQPIKLFLAGGMYSRNLKN